MTSGEVRIAKRLATYMKEIAEQQVDLHFFQGVGLALAIVYEESTGAPAISTTPKDLMTWAFNLPEVLFPRVN